MVHNQLFKPIVLGLILRVNVLIKLEELDQYINHIRKHMFPDMTGNMFPNSTPFCSVTQRSIRDPGSLETHCHYLPAISITLETVEKITFPFFRFQFFSFYIRFSWAFKSDKATCLRPLQQFCKLAQLTSCNFPNLCKLECQNM